MTEAVEDNELTMKAGETVTILEELSESWWRGSSSRGTGLIPANFVRKVAGSTQQHTLELSCDLCPKIFSTVLFLRNHMKFDHKVEGAKCEVCNFPALNKNNLALHMKSCQQYRDQTEKLCKQCDYKTNNLSQLRQHIATDHKKDVTCKFWLKGVCKKLHCQFKHQHDKQEPRKVNGPLKKTASTPWATPGPQRPSGQETPFLGKKGNHRQRPRQPQPQPRPQEVQLLSQQIQALAQQVQKLAQSQPQPQPQRRGAGRRRGGQ